MPMFRPPKGFSRCFTGSNSRVFTLIPPFSLIFPAKPNGAFKNSVKIFLVRFEMALDVN